MSMGGWSQPRATLSGQSAGSRYSACNWSADGRFEPRLSTAAIQRPPYFQLAVTPAEHVGDDRTETASHLTARTPFVPALEYKELTERAKEMDVRRTSLTAKYTYEDFRTMYGGRAIALFTVRGHEVGVVTEKSSLEGDLTLISLVPREG